MNKILLLTGVFLTPFLVSTLSANDTTATVVGGKITYKKSENISIEEEILKISLEEIQVFYVFKNNSEKEISTQVAFPLPATPVVTGNPNPAFAERWDEPYEAYAFIAENLSLADKEHGSNAPLAHVFSGAPFVNFKRTVDGGEYGYDYAIQALDPKGKDITNILNKNEIPLSSTYVEGDLGGFYAREGDCPTKKAAQKKKVQSLKKKLKKLKLLTKEGAPNWQTKTTYFWNQIFKPNSLTKVTHSYKPQVGGHWLKGPMSAKSLHDLSFFHRDILPSGKAETKTLKDFCPSESQTKDILQMFNKNTASKNKAHVHDSEVTYRVKEVRYILSTGGNWKGPIKKFRLEITPPTPNCIVLCCFEGKIVKDKNGTYVAELTNFMPTSELKILFIDPQNFGENK